MGGGLLPQVRTCTHEQMNENKGGLFDYMHPGHLIILCPDITTYTHVQGHNKGNKKK